MSNNKNNNGSSQRGKKGTVGAPSKAVKWPTTPFTMSVLYNRNKRTQCELSLRTKVNIGLDAGEIFPLTPKKQPKGSVGRPKAVYVLKDYFDKSKMVISDPPKKTKQTGIEVVETVTPAAAPIVETPIVAETPVTAEVVITPETVTVAEIQPPTVTIEVTPAPVENVIEQTVGEVVTA